MKAPSRYPDAQDFVSALAKPFESEAGSRIVEPFGIAWPEAIKLDRGLQIYTISRPLLGLDFTFKDEGMVYEREHPRVGNGPFLLTSCALWGFEKSVETYKGPLWGDLQFTDEPAEALAKLGAPTRVGRMEIHQWDLPAFKLTIQWHSSHQIRVVSYWMKEG